MKEREMEMEKERKAIYEEIRSKPRLSPLIELIEPTPLLDRKRADASSNGKVEERKDVPDTKADNGQSNLEGKSDRLQPLHVVRLASVESLAEVERKEENRETFQMERIKKNNRNGRKIRFNPYDEFSD